MNLCAHCGEQIDPAKPGIHAGAGCVLIRNPLKVSCETEF